MQITDPFSSDPPLAWRRNCVNGKVCPNRKTEPRSLDSGSYHHVALSCKSVHGSADLQLTSPAFEDRCNRCHSVVHSRLFLRQEEPIVRLFPPNLITFIDHDKTVNSFRLPLKLVRLPPASPLSTSSCTSLCPGSRGSQSISRHY